jgi:predicted acyl esterase
MAKDERWREDSLWRDTLPLDAPIGRYPGFHSRTEVLKAGSVQAKGGCPLTVDLICERDVAVLLRDGVTIYADVFRPAAVSHPIPAIVAWSPYGKGNGGNQSLDDFPFRAGVPRSALSGLQMWEAPDPAYWCAQGYAVVNVDARGAYMSEGRQAVWGTQEGRDGYDLVEWIARQSWCNGRVGFAGNSWLAIAQWFIAAERPPHLAAIAPWEGFCDAFRHNYLGGVVNTAFGESVFDLAVGLNGREDVSAMAKREPRMTPYWQDKVAQVDLIEVPAYVVGSWTNFVHTPGTFDAWLRLGSPDKWLRVHNAMEWPDFYAVSSQTDLLRFFDRYLKEEENGWEDTPRVRLAVLGSEGHDEVNRPMAEFPPQDVPHTKLALAAAKRALVDAPPTAFEEAQCNGPTDRLHFDLPITEDCEVIGFMKAQLCVQLHDGRDQDIFVAVERLDRRRRPIAARTIPVPNRFLDGLLRLVHRTGLVKPLNLLFPTRSRGSLRLSHREIDLAVSTPDRPVQRFERELPVTPGDIVTVEIAINPTAMRLQRGDTLRLWVAGHDLVPTPLPGLKHDPVRGSGRFSIWSGGEHDSHLLVPLRTK